MVRILSIACKAVIKINTGFYEESKIQNVFNTFCLLYKSLYVLYVLLLSDSDQVLNTRSGKNNQGVCLLFSYSVENHNELLLMILCCYCSYKHLYIVKFALFGCIKFIF